VADHLGIPFYVSDYQDVFRRAVIDEFVDAYVAGRTPNPCVRCNDAVKFKPLLARAAKLGAEFLATGHYVRSVMRPDGGVDLLRAVDPAKDQSYFVAGISPGALQRVIFPLGELTKDAVREHAERLGLPVASKPDSQEICFVPDGDQAAFVAREAADRLGGPGAVVSLSGMRLGQHEGRPSLQPSVSGADSASPAPSRTTSSVCGPTPTRWSSGGARTSPPGGSSRRRPAGRVVRPRAAPGSWRGSGTGTPARRPRSSRRPKTPSSSGFSRRSSAVAPGQQLVLYDGDRVVGAATIDRALGTPALAHAEASHG
jgi:tRNA-specific 2-thiouridylase